MDYKKLLKDNCMKKCINELHTTQEPWKYRHPDLYNMAMKAFDEGRAVFYYEPEDPRYPNAKLRECEPKYEYYACIKLTDEEYKELLEE